MNAVPTRRDELWRYSDFAAIEALWPPAATRKIALAEGDAREEVVHILDGGIHDVRIDLADGATLRIAFLLQSASYARVEVEAHLGQGASLDLGGAILGTDSVTQELVTRIHHDRPDASSRQRVRVVVDERATGNYLGRITVGELDKAALFYLQSRGVPLEEARALLTHAFVADAFSGLENLEQRHALEAETAAWLEAQRADRWRGQAA